MADNDSTTQAAAAATTADSATAAAPIRTLAEAMQGTAGRDYFPHERCEQCGAVMYLSGRRYVQDHDYNKHGVAKPDATGQRTSPGGAESLKYVIDRAVGDARSAAQSRARRVSQDDDD